MCILINKVIQYNNTCRGTIKLKSVGVRSSIYIDFVVGNSDKGHKFEVSDHIRISKYKIIFAKGYTTNQSEKVFVIKKVKNTVP